MNWISVKDKFTPEKEGLYICKNSKESYYAEAILVDGIMSWRPVDYESPREMTHWHQANSYICQDCRELSTKWTEINFEELPPPGYYLFKNSKTHEVKWCQVIKGGIGAPYWVTSLEKFNTATHWAPWPEDIE